MGSVRVGLVGADAGGRGWGPVAHIPAIAAVEGLELAAVCTRRPESAAAASEAYGVPGFSDPAEMAAQPFVDLVCVVVKVPGHRDAVLAAIDAGVHVYSEWPLGLSSAEATEMAAAARAKGVVSGVGLQGRHTPELATMKALVAEGWIGEVLTVDVQWLTKGPPRGDASGVPGASMFAVGGGHTLDCTTHVFGPIATLSAQTDTPLEAGPALVRDVVAHGRFASGGQLSYRMAVVPHHATGWRMAVHGSEGTLVATTGVMPQISPIQLRGARGDAPLEDIPARPGLIAVPDAPMGPARNVAQSYAALVAAIRDGRRFSADFDDAVAVHALLDRIHGAAGQPFVVEGE